MRFSLTLIFFTFLILTNLNCDEIKAFGKFKKLDPKNLTAFFLNFQNLCQKKIIFKEISEHKSYPKFGSVEAWKNICERSKNIKIEKKSVIKFVEKNFKFLLIDERPGLLTGYYEPTINVSFEKKDAFNIPVLKKNNKFKDIPRDRIEKFYDLNDVLVWTDDIIDLFFLQIQGSGLGLLENGEKIKLVYDGNNNLNYRSIGKLLKDENYLEYSNINLFTIKDWLRKNPRKVSEVLNYNERYIFFKIKPIEEMTKGALGVNLKSNISVAVDKKIYPYGIPFLLNIPNEKNTLVIGHDTGSAIKGANRVDLFLGSGKLSEKEAGMLKKKIYLFVMIPYIESYE